MVTEDTVTIVVTLCHTCLTMSNSGHTCITVFVFLVKTKFQTWNEMAWTRNSKAKFVYHCMHSIHYSFDYSPHFRVHFIYKSSENK